MWSVDLGSWTSKESEAFNGIRIETLEEAVDDYIETVNAGREYEGLDDAIVKKILWRPEIKEAVVIWDDDSSVEIYWTEE